MIQTIRLIFVLSFLALLPGATRAQSAPEPPKSETQEHLDASVHFYGERLGVRMFRKHLAAYIDAAGWPDAAAERRAARARLCRLETPREIAAALGELWLDGDDGLAA